MEGRCAARSWPSEARHPWHRDQRIGPPGRELASRRGTAHTQGTRRRGPPPRAGRLGAILDDPRELVAEDEWTLEARIADRPILDTTGCQSRTGRQPPPADAPRPPLAATARARLALPGPCSRATLTCPRCRVVTAAARSRRRPRACAGVALEQASAIGPASGSSARVSMAIAATTSSAIAFSAAVAASAPQVNGPCDATSTAGISSGSSPAPSSVSTITSPVAPRSRRDLLAVSARVTGTAPRKWSAWVVPKQRDRPAGLRPRGRGLASACARCRRCRKRR